MRLNEVKLADAPQVGGKAANLGELISIGAQVPQGFIVLHNAVLEEIIDQILAMFDGLGKVTAAVRSSATAEDGLDLSFAGQFDTYLHVNRDELIYKIQSCRKSAHNSRVAAYLKQNNLPSEALKVSVVVQAMVEPEVYGIAFSKNPLTNNADEIMIEAGYGLGEAIVSGQITPDQYVINKDGENKETFIGTQAMKLQYDGRKVVEVPLTRLLQERQKLPDATLRELIKAVTAIERHYGYPVDIEWAHDGQKLYIMQARPITT